MATSLCRWFSTAFSYCMSEMPGLVGAACCTGRLCSGCRAPVALRVVKLARIKPIPVSVRKDIFKADRCVFQWYSLFLVSLAAEPWVSA